MGVSSTITISGISYNVYGNDANEKSYFAARVGGSAYDDADTIDRKKARVSSTRWIDRLAWDGDPTVSPVPGGQDHQFPRTGLVDDNGDAVDSATIPDQVEDACYELQLQILQDATIVDNANSGSNVKKAKAGSAEVQFFTGTSGAGEASRLPQVAHELVGIWLGGSGRTVATAGGTDVESAFDDCDRYELTEGLS